MDDSGALMHEIVLVTNAQASQLDEETDSDSIMYSGDIFSSSSSDYILDTERPDLSSDSASYSAETDPDSEAYLGEVEEEVMRDLDDPILQITTPPIELRWRLENPGPSRPPQLSRELHLAADIARYIASDGSAQEHVPQNVQDVVQQSWTENADPSEFEEGFPRFATGNPRTGEQLPRRSFASWTTLFHPTPPLNRSTLTMDRVSDGILTMEGQLPWTTRR
ncbi:hypothetical protein ANO11243_052660 [Dothideomycetidae sp. 11243]|nr:hypothetical protein ANO11243_052660 [fungal sp. No.11243]